MGKVISIIVTLVLFAFAVQSRAGTEVGNGARRTSVEKIYAAFKHCV